MTIESLRRIVKRQPFEPFTIHMNDGRALRVTHPDFVLLPPHWRSTELVVAFPDGTWDFVYVRNISSVRSKGKAPPLPTKKRKNGDEPEGEE